MLCGWKYPVSSLLHFEIAFTDMWTGRNQSVQSLMVFCQPKNRIDCTENYSVSISKIIFSWSKCPNNMQFDFENRSTGNHDRDRAKYGFWKNVLPLPSQNMLGSLQLKKVQMEATCWQGWLLVSCWGLLLKISGTKFSGFWRKLKGSWVKYLFQYTLHNIWDQCFLKGFCSGLKTTSTGFSTILWMIWKPDTNVVAKRWYCFQNSIKPLWDTLIP